MSSKKKAEAPRPAEQAPVEAVKPPIDFFDKLDGKGGWVVAGIVAALCIMVFFGYLVGEKAYFFKDIGSDTLNLSYPYLGHLADYIKNAGVPKWSFSFGMGQSLFPFFLRDPFDIFLLMAGKDHLLFGIVMKEVVKVILCGITFYAYLRTLRLSHFTAIAGSLFFAFSGFSILGGQWYIFSFEAFNMALLLLAFEQLLQHKKWYLFPVPILLIAMSQPFNLYVYGLFLATYAIFRLAQMGTLKARHTAVLFAQMIGAGLLGLLFSAPFMIENIVQILESPRGSGTNSYAHILSGLPMFGLADNVQLGTSILRFFSSDILGSGNEFTGWQNILEAPLFYIGLPALILMPQVFPALARRQRIVFGVFMGLWFMPIIFPWFRYAFWLFSGDYFRGYSVIVAFILLYYALFALDHIVRTRKINLVVLGITMALLFIFLYYPYAPGADSLRNNVVTPALNPAVSVFVCFMLIVYGILLYLLGRPGSAPGIKYALMAAMIVEVLYLSRVTVNDRDAVTAADASQKIGYNDYSVEAVNFIKQHDKSFYRIDKTYGSTPAMHSSLNDGMAQGYYGTSAYNPFNQEYYVKYLQLMGISNKANELESRWATGLPYRPILQAENSVKYILAKKNINPLWSITCDTVGKFGDVIAFHNKFLIPFGFTYSSYIRQSAFEKASMTQKDFLSLKAVSVADEDVSKLAGMKEYAVKDTLPQAMFTTEIFKQGIAELSRDTMVVSRIDNKEIAGTINVTDDKMLYLSVPYDGGWSLTVDGQPRDKMILDDGMTGVMLKKGSHTIHMGYELRYYKKGWLLCLVGLVFYVGMWLMTRRKKAIPEVTV